MKGRFRRYKYLGAAIGGIVLGAFLMTGVLHPVRHLQVAFLALMSLALAALAVFFARKTERPVREPWVDWVALGATGLTLWWIFWIPHLLLPFSLQVLCSILGISLGLIAAVALHRALPRPFHRLGALFPVVPLVLSILLPLGPARWETGPISPYEVHFLGRLMVVRAAEGPVLVYPFPREAPAVAGFAPHRVVGFPGFALGPVRVDPLQLDLGLPGWILTIAAAESERQVGIAEVYSGGVLNKYTYYVQTESRLQAVIPGPERTFLVLYRDREQSMWAQRVDTRGRAVSDPVRLPGRPHALAASPDGTMIAYVEGDLRSVRVVDIGTGEDALLDLSEELAAAGGEKTSIHTLAIAPDGKEIALGLSWKGGAECPGLVWRVDLAGNVRAQLLTPTGKEPFISVLRYSPDGVHLVAEICCFPSRLVVVDLDSGRMRNLPLGGGGFREAAFSPDGRYLVATRYDGIYIWRI